ncbi:MAG: hypothetical protein JWM95_1723 [Gemmatimonadetes bacterium]|nr:hypothetical protein [Gemmatimonadota bacterium]
MSDTQDSIPSESPERETATRDLILAQREAVRTYVRSAHGRVTIYDATEKAICGLFPLPLKRIPNEQTDDGGFTWRVNGDHLEYLSPDRFNPRWISAINLGVATGRAAAIATVLTTPIVEVPEDG